MQKHKKQTHNVNTRWNEKCDPVAACLIFAMIKIKLKKKEKFRHEILCQFLTQDALIAKAHCVIWHCTDAWRSDKEASAGLEGADDKHS